MEPLPGGAVASSASQKYDGTGSLIFKVSLQKVASFPWYLRYFCFCCCFLKFSGSEEFWNMEGGVLLLLFSTFTA